jgi:hypothetical protein
MRQSIGLLIFGAQSIAVGLAPELEEDALSPDEINMLADAFADEADAYPRVKKWIASVQSTSTHAKLIVTLIAIAVPRLVRRGILPEGSGELANFAVAMVPGSASSSDRGDREREINPDEPRAENPLIFGGGPDEGGQGPIPDGSDDASRENAVGSTVQSYRVASPV